MSNILNKIEFVGFPIDQYYKTAYTKIQIVGHHTVGGTAESSRNWWKSTPSREGTAIIIKRNGTPLQLFGSQYYAGHIGAVGDEMASFGLLGRNCSKYSIGVEFANHGALKKKNGKYYDYYNNKVTCDVVHYPDGYRGYYYFEKYSSEQIQTYKELLIYWSKRYAIPLDYHEDIWDVTIRALRGDRGHFTHVSFRDDKSDLHPQKELVDMLKSLDPNYQQ